MPSAIITFLDNVVLFLSLFVLGKAGLDDWLHREVQDKVWVGYALVVLPYWLIRLVMIGLDPTLQNKIFFILLMIINVVLAIMTAVGLGLLGMWGGGDVKGFMVLGFGVTTLPLLLLEPTTMLYLLNQLIPPSFTILSNAYLILLPLPGLIFLRNMYLYVTRSHQFVFPSGTSRLRKIMLLFLARPYRVTELEHFHYWHYDLMELPASVIQWIKIHESDFYEEDETLRQKLKEELEQLLEDRPLQWQIYMRVGLIESDFDILIKQKVLAVAKEERKEIIWAQRSIPFVLFMFFGLIIAALSGNILIFLLLFP